MSFRFWRRIRLAPGVTLNLSKSTALVLNRVMRIRLKAKGHAASPRTALDLLARIQKHTTHIGPRTFTGPSKTQPEQLDIFDALSLAKPT
jgi:hypothetical protein